MKNSTAIILIVISIGLYYTVISPRYDEIKVLRDQASQYQQITGNVNDLTKRRDDLSQTLLGIPSSEITRLDKALPDSLDTVTLANDLSSIAAKYGISLKSLQTAPDLGNNTQEIVTGSAGGSDASAVAGPTITVSTVGNLQKASINMAFVASYPAFRAFLKDIETNLRIVNVKSIAFQFQPSQNGLTDFTVNLETYWIK